MESAGKAVQTVTTSAMGMNLVLTLVLSASLTAMWNMVHILQVITFLPNLLDWPANAELIISSLKEAAELEQMS